MRGKRSKEMRRNEMKCNVGRVAGELEETRNCVVATKTLLPAGYFCV